MKFLKYENLFIQNKKNFAVKVWNINKFQYKKFPILFKTSKEIYEYSFWRIIRVVSFELTRHNNTSIIVFISIVSVTNYQDPCMKNNEL